MIDVSQAAQYRDDVLDQATAGIPGVLLLGRNLSADPQHSRTRFVVQTMDPVYTANTAIGTRRNLLMRSAR